ncbi:MAG: ACP S-malonyltransferase, partial [Pseudobdellovibrionaceae bacterium]
MMTLLFPGQGSQQPGMGRFLFDNFKIAKELFEEASEALSQDMKKLCFEGSEADLALTENTQPALLLVSTVTQRVLKSEYH